MPATFFADILLPLPLPGTFTYRVPRELADRIVFGIRVVVPFGKNKLYSGLVTRVHENAPQQVNTKYIMDVVDEVPVISPKQFELWQWMSDYYMCPLGEVMSCALPSALKLAGETRVMLHPDFDGDLTSLTETQVRLIELVAQHQSITISELSKLLQLPKVIPVVKTLVEHHVVVTEDEIQDPYRPKKETHILLSDTYNQDESAVYTLIDTLEKESRRKKQAETLLVFLMLLQKKGTAIDFKSPVKKSDLMAHERVSSSSVQKLIEKGVFIVKEVTISRLKDYNTTETIAEPELSDAQERARREIESSFDRHSVTLLHGVTGSGKTEIYIKMIAKVLKEGRQVLYLLPEIALTSQIVNRLRKYFGDKVGVYHSRFNEFEKVEIWDRVLHNDLATSDGGKYQLILGARSALLLPFNNLGLIIVDEEHDSSYKQMDPAPRYHARDCAVILAKIHQSKVLLGTATPSLETFYNVKQGRYGYVTLTQRYANSVLPEIWVVNMVESIRQGKVTGVFSQFLIDKMAAALEKKEQVILFQNRRGFSVRLLCNHCQTSPTCRYCDVTLTYHKFGDLLKCHYCGYAIEVPKVCPTCQSPDIEMRGFGTEKIEEELAAIFPDAVIRRMDLDTTRSKSAYQKIISDFEQHKTDILIGTQMVTKGLDFDRVSVVGVLGADNLISFPDFRSFERAFQIMAQVSGRAGRKEVPGNVVIQSYQPEHQALKFVVSNDFNAMYHSQIAERQQFYYPPICRLIKLTLKHKEEKLVNEAGASLVAQLREAFPKRVIGPEFPLVARIQTYYLKDIWIKFAKDEHLTENKKKLSDILHRFRTESAFKAVHIVINVDA
ncbi:MAG: primosomal protein N' [Bacteroidales bacterium]|nr:primosomal protein N' [Bacteroidales bacterium]